MNLQSKSSNFMLKEFKGKDYVLKNRIKIVGVDEIGYIDLTQDSYDMISTPAVYNCSIIIVIFENIIFLAHISSKRTFKEFFSAIFREATNLGIENYSPYTWFFDKSFQLPKDKNTLPNNYSPTLIDSKIVGNFSEDFSYFINRNKIKVKHKREYFYDISYSDFD